ncbi:MAG: hypothetical protein V3T77_10965, partial [Planctomycetota bacterium]
MSASNWAGRCFASRPALLFWGSLLLFAGWSRGSISDDEVQTRYLVASQIWDNGTIPDLQQHSLGQSLTMLPAIITADLSSRFLVDAERQSEFQHWAGPFIYKTVILPLLAALALLAFYILGVRLGLSPEHAVWCAITLGFASSWLFYVKTIGTGPEVTAWALWAMVCYTGTGERAKRLGLASLFLGLTLLYHQELLIPVTLGVVLMVLHERRHQQFSFASLGVLLVPMTLCGLAALWYGYTHTGQVFAAGLGTGGETSQPGVFASYPGVHTATILFGAQNGFFWFNPILFTSVLLLIPGGRRWHPALTRAALPVAAYLLLVASLAVAPQVSGWGQRLLVPIIPFLVLALGLALSPRMNQRGWRLVLLGVFALNIIFQATVAFDDHLGVQEQTRQVKETLAKGGEETLTGWRSNDLAGKLRNLGIPLGDSPAVQQAWKSSEQRRTGFRENLWWLKMSHESESKTMVIGSFAAGLLMLISGLLCLFFACYSSAAFGGASTLAPILPKKKR